MSVSKTCTDGMYLVPFSKTDVTSTPPTVIASYGTYSRVVLSSTRVTRNFLNRTPHRKRNPPPPLPHENTNTAPREQRVKESIQQQLYYSLWGSIFAEQHHVLRLFVQIYYYWWYRCVFVLTFVPSLEPVGRSETPLVPTALSCSSVLMSCSPPNSPTPPSSLRHLRTLIIRSG